MPAANGKPSRGIKCPQCGSGKSRITHTERLIGDRVRRRRVCKACKRRFVTLEAPTRFLKKNCYM